MNIYRKNLWRLGIAVIGLSLLDLMVNLGAGMYLVRSGRSSMNWAMGQLVGTTLKNLFCILGGTLGCILYHTQSQRINRFIRGECALIVAAVLSIVIPARGGLDVVLDFPLVVASMLTYTMNQFRNRQQLWMRISLMKASVLDLKLGDTSQWFDPLVLGPHLALNADVAAAVHRFLVSEKVLTPLEINLHGLGTVSESIQGTMREIFQEHYADEERRVERYLEGRYNRALALIIVSLLAVATWVRVSRFTGNGAATIMTILSNFAGFSLWQIGNTYFERTEGYNELARVMIACHAQIHFS